MTRSQQNKGNDAILSDEWTIEAAIAWKLQECCNAADNSRNELMEELDGLQKSMLENEYGEKENDINTSAVVSTKGGAKVPSKATSATPATTTKFKNRAVKSTVPTITVHVTVLEGPHKGQTRALTPKTNAPCMVGRSAGAKFRKSGLSFKEDSEVSTTHGKFQLLGRKIFFTDVGSSNGTRIDNEELRKNVEYEVEDGMTFQVGGTIFTVRLETPN
mmetsp:Transcript_6324/g.9194  ORF Transcript_6324/g.9194 Transcript_6324/m.9194 type:complete len:217 (+) Transcript_6324:74-724(+)